MACAAPAARVKPAPSGTAACICRLRPPDKVERLEAFLISTGLVAIAEIGDKTMLLAIALAATWRRPVPIILGILVATVANHAFAAIFWTTAAAFFLIEMGDKTQIATAGLAIRFENLPLVVAGSTLGMMLVNGPAVLLGEATAQRLPLKYIRMAAAAGFALTGLWILVAG